MKLCKAYYLLPLLFAISTSAQTLVQTFEAGEDTSNWGSSWQSPGGFATNGPGFMDPSIGGNNAGFRTTEFGQETSRDFRNNTAGVNVRSAAYEVSLLLQMNFHPPGSAGPASGTFDIIDGTFGENATNIRLTYNAGIPSVLEALDGSSWRTVDVDLAVGVPYSIQYIVNPVTATYSVTVAQLNTLGVVQDSAILTGLAITGNALNNHNNGQLFFYANTSAGFVSYQVDNIRVTNNIPEPASAALFLVAGAMVCFRRRQSGRR
jgi:hypothetical protein